MVDVDETMMWGLVRLVLVLIVIVPAATYATRWYAKRQAPGKELRVREALSLGTNKALYVVEWKEQLLLLGVTNHSITVLEQQVLDVEDVDEGATE